MALGVMGMSYESYLQLTPSQFSGAYTRFIDKVQKERQQTELTAWQVARWQVFKTIRPPQGRISVLDLIKLPGDDELRKPKAGKVIKDESRFRALAAKWK